MFEDTNPTTTVYTWADLQRDVAAFQKKMGEITPKPDCARRAWLAFRCGLSSPRPATWLLRATS